MEAKVLRRCWLFGPKVKVADVVLGDLTLEAKVLSFEAVLRVQCLGFRTPKFRFRVRARIMGRQLKAQTWCLEACLPGQQTWLGEFSAPLQAPHLQNGASGGPATKANQQMILVHGQGLGVQVRVCAAPGATPSKRCANGAGAGSAARGALAS